MQNAQAHGFTTDLAPVIVTSPTIRSGTTLLQRLLCSSSNALIYGEECGKDLELFLQIYNAKATGYSLSRSVFSSSLENVLRGEVNDWILSLMPDIDGYTEALGRGAFSGLGFCRDYAAGVGRPVWGIKYPGWTPPFLRLLRKLLPGSRLVIIYRELVGCLRSAKARRSVNSEEEARQFCALWSGNLSFMLGLKDEPTVLLIKYSDLVKEPLKVIGALEGFAGVRDMRPEVLSHKINTWVSGEDPAASRPGYIEPAALTAAEMRMAEEFASSVKL